MSHIQRDSYLFNLNLFTVGIVFCKLTVFQMDIADNIE